MCPPIAVAMFFNVVFENRKLSDIAKIFLRGVSVYTLVRGIDVTMCVCGVYL
jgi:hypothetical protein